MNNCVFTIENIINLVKPIAEKYHVKEIYLFGSYARGEANVDSDLDFLVYGGEDFKLTLIFAFAEELRAALKKNVDVFEIHEINKDSAFYNTIMKEKLRVVYTKLTEIEEDYFLLSEANKRMENNGNNRTISFDSIMDNLEIREDELLDTEDVKIE